MRSVWVSAWVLGMLGASGGAMANDHEAEVDAWHQKRVDRLRAPDGWLALAGLFWLEPGDNALGSSPEARVRLPQGKVPAQAGTLTLLTESKQVRLKAPAQAGWRIDDEPVNSALLASDASGKPTIVHQGSLSFFVIQRGDKIGVRVRDSDSPARQAFKGIERFAVSPKWRVTAKWIPYTPTKQIEVPTVLNTIEAMPSTGALEFEMEGKAWRLDAIDEGGDSLFVIFADATNGRDTYGAGRFVYVPKPQGGTTTIDFNKAYNPPCAFTPYATCPLPPKQNRLGLRVTAGEKRYQ